jgi:hypothetical protein
MLVVSINEVLKNAPEREFQKWEGAATLSSAIWAIWRQIRRIHDAHDAAEAPWN